MRKILFILTFLILGTLLYAEENYSVTFNRPTPETYQLKFAVKDWKFETVSYDGVNYKKLLFNKSTVTEKKGYAELPFISASVQLSDKKNVDLHIVSTDYTDIVLDHPLVPSRGVFYRNDDPDKIPYKIAAESITNEFYPGKLAYSEEPYIVRDVRGTNVRFYPFQWNAATNTLRVYTDVTIELKENNAVSTNPLVRKNNKPVREAIGLYNSMFINFEKTRYDLTMAEYGDILVVTTQRDEEAIEPYIVWKKEKGFNISKEVVATGTNVKNLIKQKYNENNNLMYVLLVGDWEDIKCDLQLLNGDAGPTDPTLGYVVGSDNYPDIAIGRFSAKTPAHVAIQVNKTINYEKNPNMDPDWHETFIGIGSNEGPGDDYERDYLHVQRIYDQRLKGFTYNAHKENYGANPNVGVLANSVNNGASTIAYCGHGQYDKFVTTGYNNIGVNSSTNGNKLPFIVAVACYTGGYNIENKDCFGEAWLKKEDGGAILAWMSSVQQPWMPPQRGQDYFYDILTGGFDYSLYPGQEGINTTEQRTHWGSIAVNSLCLMLAESATEQDLVTTKTWITFGDPSLQLRTKTPDEITISNEYIYKGRKFETYITHAGIPLKDALVCISQNGVYKKAITDDEGKVSIEHTFDTGEVLLVVTAFNTTTIYKNITCENIEGSHVIYENAIINDENGRIDYFDGNIKLNMSVKNIGIAVASDVIVKLTTEDEYISIIKDEQIFPSVDIDKVSSINDAFEIKVDPSIPDEHYITFLLTASQGGKTANSKFILKAHAATLIIEDIIVQDNIKGDNNGTLESGEIAKILFKIKNTGSANALDIRGNLSVDGNNISVLSEALQNFSEELPPNSIAEAAFIIQENQKEKDGHVTRLTLQLVDKYEIAREFPLQITVPKFYCVPSGYCGEGDGIKGFKLGRIDNLNNGCTGGGYSNYTSQSTPLGAGNTYDITIVTGRGSQEMSLWIDFNNDGKFETSERLISKYSMPTTGEYTIPVSIPSSLSAIEACRLRVMVGASSSFLNEPCSDLRYGETEDYTVRITSNVTLPTPQNLKGEQIGKEVRLTWDVPAGNTPKSYKLKRNGTWINDIQGTTYTDEITEYGTIAYAIQAVYNNGESELSNPLVMEIMATPENIKMNIDKDCNVSIIWEAVKYAEGYNIYRSDKESKLNNNLLTETGFSDFLPNNNNYSYQIGVVYANEMEVKSQKVDVKCGGGSISTISSGNDIKVYPNPVQDVLTIIADNTIFSVILFNMAGHEIYNLASDSSIIKLNVKELKIETGIYFLQIKTENSIITKKIVVKQ